MIQLAFYLGTKRENPQHAKLVDRLICWWTRSRFSHVEFISANTAAGGPAVCWAASNRDGGVRSTLIDVRNGRWVVVTVPHGDYRRMLETYQAQEGRPYGRLCALAHAVPPRLRPVLRTIGRHLPYCSSIAAVGYGLEDSWLSPEELFQAVTGRPSVAPAFVLRTA